MFRFKQPFLLGKSFFSLFLSFLQHFMLALHHFLSFLNLQDGLSLLFFKFLSISRHFFTFNILFYSKHNHVRV